jgi:tetratricopeptide (TPR) repeat protein
VRNASHWSTYITYIGLVLVTGALLAAVIVSTFRPGWLVSVHRERAQEYTNKHDYAGVIKEYDQIIEIWPDYANAYYTRGLNYLNIGKYENAISDFTYWLQLEPDYYLNYIIYNSRCWAYFKVGDYSNDLPDCHKALEIKPDFVSALDSRARVYKALDRIDDAIADFKQIIKLGTNPELTRQAEQE